mmetsp:Transcript_14598/g.20823  ORF Transcript_14598/g.20823 Transcript_14598/m.20823 type:complete len:627 (+) Transcript_14598:133-2013(+)
MDSEYHERIILTPVNAPNQNSKQVEVTVETLTIHNEIYSNTLNFYNLGDKLLLSILETQNIDSLLVSSSDSSSSSRRIHTKEEGTGSCAASDNISRDNIIHSTHEDHRELKNDVSSYNDDNPWINEIGDSSGDSYSFPIGTYVKYKPKRFARIEVDRHALLRTLTSRRILCGNVPLESLTTQTIHQYTQHRVDPFTKEEIWMLPDQNKAFCNYDTLFKNVLYHASPCEHGSGVFATLESRMLNHQNVVHRSTWINIRKRILNSSDDGSQKQVVSIHRGVRYTVVLGNDRPKLYQLFTLENKVKHAQGAENHLKACVFTDSSHLLIQNRRRDPVKYYDLHQTNLNFHSLIVSFEDDFKYAKSYPISESSNENEVGISRSILRRNGASNGGTFQTQIYYYSKLGENTSDMENRSKSIENNVTVAVLELYPKVVKPILHSLRFYAVEKETTKKEETRNYNQTSTVSSLDMNDLTSYSLTTSEDGSVTLAFRTSIPSDKSIFITMDYLPRFLPFDKWSPVPNRGVDVTPSYATFTILPALSMCATTKSSTFVQQPYSFQLYSNSLILMPPVPDLSMPYNVIGLCGTFFAMIVGLILNHLVRKSTEKITSALDEKKKSFVQKIKTLFIGRR